MTSPNTSNVVPFKHVIEVPQNVSPATQSEFRERAYAVVDAPPEIFAAFAQGLEPASNAPVGTPTPAVHEPGQRAQHLPAAEWAEACTQHDASHIPVHVLITRDDPAPHLETLDQTPGPCILIWSTPVGVWSLAFGPGRSANWHNFAGVVPRLQTRAGKPLDPEVIDCALLRAARSTAIELNRNPHCFGRLGNLLAWHDESQVPHVVLPPPTLRGEPDPLDDHRDDTRTLAYENRAIDTALPLIDPYTGIITGVTTQLGPEGYPRHFAYTEFTLAAPFDLPAFAPDTTPGIIAKVGELRHGVDPSSPTAESALRALGRYCSSVTDQGEIWHASRQTLIESGENVVDLRRFDYVLTRSLAMAQRDPQAPIWWIKGDYEGLPVWVPRDTVFRTFERGSPHPHIELSGLGTGLRYESAVEMALNGVLCQDALAVWWSRGGQAQQLPTPASMTDAWVTESGDPCPLTVTLLDIRNTHDVPTVLAIVDGENYTGFGCATHPNYETACELATTEALLHHHLQSLKQLRVVTDAQRQAMHARVSDTVLPGYPASTGLGSRESLQRNGWEYVIVDLTTDDARACGCHAVRAVVPGLAAPTPGAVPSSPMARILRAAAYLGWENNPLRESYYELF